MYKILKRGYYYNNAHKSEDEFLSESYPTEDMAYMAAELNAFAAAQELNLSNRKITAVQRACSLRSMKTRMTSILWFVAGTAMIIRLKAGIRSSKKKRSKCMSEKRKDYISWDEYFMGIAMLSAMRSKDPTVR